MNLETDVALLKSDVNRMTSLFEKLDSAIEKMGDVSNNIARMLAVHEERLNKQDHTDEELFTLVEKRRQEIQGDIKELHSRITTVDRNLSDKIELTERRIMDEFKSLRDHITEHNEKEDRELEALSKWKWMVAGGVVVVAWIISNIRLDQLVKLFN